MSFTTIDGDKVISLKKYTSESMFQFGKRVELYTKAINKGIDDDKAIMLSISYTNKLKYNVTYNTLLESDIKSIVSYVD